MIQMRGLIRVIMGSKVHLWAQYVRNQSDESYQNLEKRIQTEKSKAHRNEFWKFLLQSMRGSNQISK